MVLIVGTIRINNSVLNNTILYVLIVVQQYFFKGESCFERIKLIANGVDKRAAVKNAEPSYYNVTLAVEPMLDDAQQIFTSNASTYRA